jgi:O-antigen/teichoic acid export membrane protein
MIRRVLLGIAAMFYSRVSISAAQLFLVPTLALSWGLPRYGQWLMLSTIPTFLAASDLGFGVTATMRLIAEVARGDIDEARLTYRAARTIVMILSAVVLTLAAPIVLALPASWLAVHNAMGSEDARFVIGLLCLYGLVGLQGQLFMAVARATGRIAQAIMIETTVGLAEALAVGVTALAKGSPVMAAAGLLVVRAISVAAMYVLSRRAAPWRRGPSQKVGHRLRQMWRPAMAATLIPVSQALYLQGSAIAVGFAGGAAIVPIVTSLRTLSRIALQAIAIVAVPLMPEFAAMYVRSDRQRASLIVSGLIAISVIAGGGYALVLGFAGKPLIALWTGGSFVPPQAMVTLTAIGLAASVVWNPLSDLLLSINRHESFSIAYCICALLTAALTVPLVHALGVTGAAAANLLLESVMAFVVVRALVAVTGPIQMSVDTLAHVLPPRWRSALRLR